MSIPVRITNDQEGESIEVRPQPNADEIIIVVELLGDSSIFALQVGKLSEGIDEVDMLVSGLRMAQGAVRRDRGDFDGPIP